MSEANHLMKPQSLPVPASADSEELKLPPDEEYYFTGKYLIPHLSYEFFTNPATRNKSPWNFDEDPREPLSPR